MNAVKSSVGRIMPPRFAAFFVIGIACVFALLQVTTLHSAVMGGFDVAAAIFLASCAPMFGYDAKRLRKAAAENDANRLLLLIISILLTLVILSIMGIELSAPEELSDGEKLLIVGSTILVWLFANGVYMLHYAHLYYSADGDKDCGGLKFPATPTPLMSDFAYYAFTLGVAVQTSDVSIERRHIRNVTTIHCIVGFFFNLGVLALTINVLAS